MANIKSQKKRILIAEKRRMANASFKSKMRTAIKKVKVNVEKKDLEAAKESLKVAFSLMDKAIKGNIQHKNWVANHKSQLSNLVNALEKELSAPQAEASQA